MREDEQQVLAMPILTDHARQRAQDRGIPLRILGAIFAHADRRPHVGNGCRSLMVSRRKLKALKDLIPAADRERMDGVVLVMDREIRVIVKVIHASSAGGRRYRRPDFGIRLRRRPWRWTPRISRRLESRTTPAVSGADDK
jgi:hypothetical protein